MKMTITDVPFNDTIPEMRKFAREQHDLGIDVLVMGLLRVNDPGVTDERILALQGNDDLVVTIEGPASDVLATLEQLGYDL